MPGAYGRDQGAHREHWRYGADLRVLRAARGSLRRERAFPREQSLVRYRTNDYSVPVAFDRDVLVRGTSMRSS